MPMPFVSAKSINEEANVCVDRHSIYPAGAFLSWPKKAGQLHAAKVLARLEVAAEVLATTMAHFMLKEQQHCSQLLSLSCSGLETSQELAGPFIRAIVEENQISEALSTCLLCIFLCVLIQLDQQLRPGACICLRKLLEVGMARAQIRILLCLVCLSDICIQADCEHLFELLCDVHLAVLGCMTELDAL